MAVSDHIKEWAGWIVASGAASLIGGCAAAIWYMRSGWKGRKQTEEQKLTALQTQEAAIHESVERYTAILIERYAATIEKNKDDIVELKAASAKSEGVHRELVDGLCAKLEEANESAAKLHQQLEESRLLGVDLKKQLEESRLLGVDLQKQVDQLKLELQQVRQAAVGSTNRLGKLEKGGR